MPRSLPKETADGPRHRRRLHRQGRKPFRAGAARQPPRAHDLERARPLTVDRDNDKNPVVALREIADQTLAPDDLKEDLIHSLQKYVEVDEPEAEPVPMIAARQDAAERR